MVPVEPDFLRSGILIFRIHSKEENAATQFVNEKLKYEVKKQLSQQERKTIKERETGLNPPLVSPAIPLLHK